VAKVFISWSGPISRQVAEALRDWLPSVVQAIQPYFSPDDIAKGSRWSKEIAQELESSSVGLICLTRDNLDAPWILFEAGALSKNLDRSRVCPILFGVRPADVKEPLAQFQCAEFSKDEMKKVVTTVNSQLEAHKLLPRTLDTVFEKWWPDFDERVQQIMSQRSQDLSQTIRSDREILEEVLQHVRKRNSNNHGSQSILTHPARWLRQFLVDLYDRQVEEFAAKASLTPDDDDPNATPWQNDDTIPQSNDIDGYWFSRWNGGRAKDKWAPGMAMISSLGSMVIIMFDDPFSTYLIVARRDDPTRMVGRYINLSSDFDSTPWVGEIVSRNRIDGVWTQGRWDFRRAEIIEADAEGVSGQDCAQQPPERDK